MRACRILTPPPRAVAACCLPLAAGCSLLAVGGWCAPCAVLRLAYAAANVTVRNCFVGGLNGFVMGNRRLKVAQPKEPPTTTRAMASDTTSDDAMTRDDARWLTTLVACRLR